MSKKILVCYSFSKVKYIALKSQAANSSTEIQYSGALYSAVMLLNTIIATIRDLSLICNIMMLAICKYILFFLVNLRLHITISSIMVQIIVFS